MKVKRADRLIDMTRYMLERPHQLVSLNFFAERYGAAKSSISEDLGILKRTFQDRGTGLLETIPGATGGTRFTPYILKEEAQTFVDGMVEELSADDRYLPGGFVYMSDVLSQPNNLRQIGRIIATRYLNQPIDAVLTVATKGVPIAQNVAYYLGAPFLIARHAVQITEGSTVSVNYVTGSSQRIEQMALSKRSLGPDKNVLIVDDYMKAGGTIEGLRALASEFGANVVGEAVFAEAEYDGHRKNDDYTSLISFNPTDGHTNAKPGNFTSTVFK